MIHVLILFHGIDVSLSFGTSDLHCFLISSHSRHFPTFIHFVSLLSAAYRNVLYALYWTVLYCTVLYYVSVMRPPAVSSLLMLMSQKMVAWLGQLNADTRVLQL